MFITTIQGLIVSVAIILGSTAVAYRFKPARIETRSDKILYLVFQVAVFSSIWGTTAPTLGSSITVFRVAILAFWALFCWRMIRSRKNPFRGLSAYHWILGALLIFMLANGIVTLLFFSADASYTFSHVTNLLFDVLLCSAVFFYVRTQGVLRGLMAGLTVTAIGQMATGVYECFAGPMYATTHMKSIGPNFLGLMNLHLPTVSFMNTNDYSASLFFLVMLVIVYWLYRFINGKSAKLSIAIIVMLLSGQWFVSYCGGGVLVQIGIIIFVVVFLLVACVWAIKNKKAIILVMPLIPIAFAIGLQVSPSIDLVAPSDVSQVQKEAIDGFSGLGTGTDKTMVRTVRYRSTLLKFSLETFAHHPLGMGMGNTQKLAEADSQLMAELGNRSKLHCYLAECMADYGLAFVVLGLVAVFLMLKHAFLAMRSNDGSADSLNRRFLVALLLATLPCAVFISTAPSTAQDLKAMWIYLSVFVIMLESCARGRGLVFNAVEMKADVQCATPRESR